MVTPVASRTAEPLGFDFNRAAAPDEANLPTHLAERYISPPLSSLSDGQKLVLAGVAVAGAGAAIWAFWPEIVGGGAVQTMGSLAAAGARTLSLGMSPLNLQIAQTAGLAVMGLGGTMVARGVSLDLSQHADQPLGKATGITINQSKKKTLAEAEDAVKEAQQEQTKAAEHGDIQRVTDAMKKLNKALEERNKIRKEAN